MFRYRLRTLLIGLAVLPPLLWIGWTKYEAWRVEQVRQEQRTQMALLQIRKQQAAALAYLAAQQAKSAAHRAESE